MRPVHSLTIAIGLLAFVCGVVALAIVHSAPAFVFLFWGMVIVIAVAFERYRYKPIETSTPAGNWQRTSERFLDEQGRPVTVWLDPQTGERKYVQD